MTASLASSYRYCEALTRREAGNFYPAFRILPAVQRRSMCALYAFMRIADDISDEPAAIEQKREQLGAWREALRQALAGNYGHRALPALHDAVTRHGGAFTCPARTSPASVTMSIGCARGSATTRSDR